MNIIWAGKKIQEWYHLGGLELVLKGVFTKVESRFLNVDDSESPVTITLNGTDYQVCDGEPVYRWKRFERGVIMPEVKRAMVEILNISDVFVDIGAATGDTPIYAHSIVGDGGEIHAFEPDPFQFEGLERNIEHNRLKNVQIYNQAVGNRNGELKPEQVIGGGILKRNTQDIGMITATTLDRFLSEQGISPDLVKIDVDGVENKVLRGCVKTVIGQCPIILELHHSGILENRSETIDWIFENTNKIVFLGVQGDSVSDHKYGDILCHPDDLENDVVTNLLIKC